MNSNTKELPSVCLREDHVSGEESPDTGRGSFAGELGKERNEQYTIPELYSRFIGPSKTKFTCLVQRIIHNSYLIHEHVITMIIGSLGIRTNNNIL